ncbi:MAG: hypothetical protein U0930_16350 [Pirellulales bacterium]
MTVRQVAIIRRDFRDTLDELASNAPLELSQAQLDLLERRFFEIVERVEESLELPPVPQPFGIFRCFCTEMKDLFAELCISDDSEFTNSQIDVIEMRFNHLVELLERRLMKLSITNSTAQGDLP